MDRDRQQEFEDDSAEITITVLLLQGRRWLMVIIAFFAGCHGPNDVNASFYVDAHAIPPGLPSLHTLTQPLI